MEKLTQQLLLWYDENGRDMPWRVKKSAHENPYAVWISEIMLQQTTVKTVVDYFIRWMHRFPDIETLANAALQDVLLMWQGLGYYTRAKKIHECAQLLMAEYNGHIPNNRDTLLKLPGIGPYTASSICAFAFNMPETVVDGNVIRVIARLKGLTHAVTKEEIYQLALPLTPAHQGGDYASAIMDLGATVCTPTSPKCTLCPWQKSCIAHQKNLTASIPLIYKPEKQERSGIIYFIIHANGDVLIRKRPGTGLLSGLYEFPWHYGDTPLLDNGIILSAQPLIHVFTHFKLTLKPVVRYTETQPTQSDLNGQDDFLNDSFFVSSDAFSGFPFSTLMKKAIHIFKKIKSEQK